MVSLTSIESGDNMFQPVRTNRPIFNSDSNIPSLIEAETIK